MINYYEVLGIAEDTTADRISKTGRFMLEQTHPYVTGKKETGAAFRQVYEALAILADSELRAEYNYTLSGAKEQGNIAGTALPNGAVSNRIKSAKIEAEELEKDFLLFADKFIDDVVPGNKENSLEASETGNGFSVPGLLLVIAGIICFTKGNEAGGYSTLLYIIGALLIIGGVLLYKKTG